MKKIFIFCAFLLAPSIIFAQSDDKPAEWTKVESPKGDLSFIVPPNFLVDNEDGEFRVFAFLEKVKINVDVQPIGNAKSHLKEQRRFPVTDKDAELSRFTLGDFIGDVYRYDREKSFSVIIYAASSKAYYSISAYSSDAENPVLLKFLRSIKLDNQPLIKQQSQPNQAQESPAVSIASLRTSPIVAEALKRKGHYKGEVVYDSKDYDAEKKDLPENSIDYSRPLTILRKPRAAFTDSARQQQVQTSIRLKVHFRADGEIGDITVLSPYPDKGLSKNAVTAARGIKFLPAEIGGKPIDEDKTVEYTFTLY